MNMNMNMNMNMMMMPPPGHSHHLSSYDRAHSMSSIHDPEFDFWPPTQYKLEKKHNWRSSIAQGRNELMKLAGEVLPESSFELSLKDIVNELLTTSSPHPRGTEEVDCGGSVKLDGSFHFPTTTHDDEQQQQQQQVIKKQDGNTKPKNNSSLHKQYGVVQRWRSRSSMDKGVFFIKVFNPATLSWKTNTKSTRNWLEHTKKTPPKEVVAKEGHVSVSSDTTKRMTRMQRISTFLLGCWPWLCARTHKSKQQRS